MNPKKVNLCYYASLICAIWFTLTSAAWTYLANVVISFPFGLASFLLLRAGKKIEGRTNRFKTIEIILIVGCVVSFVVFMGFMIFD